MPFCTKCGKKLEENAKFCSGCGAPALISKPEAPVEQAVEAPAPVEAAAEIPAPVEQAVETPAPVEAAAEIPAPVEQTPEAPAPVEQVAEAPAPVEQAVEAPAPVEPVAKAPVPVEAAAEAPAPVEPAAEAPASVEPTAEIPAPVEAAAEIPAPVEAAAEATAPIEAAAEATAPVEATPEAPAPAKQPKKKKKTGLIIGLSAGAAVLGAAAVGYFCFNNQVMRLFMGDTGFAINIERKSYTDYIPFKNMEDFDETYCKYIDSIASIAAESNKSDDDDDDDETAALIALFNTYDSLAKITEQYGSDIEIHTGTSLEMDELFDLIIGAASTQSEDLSKALTAIKEGETYIRVINGENCDLLSLITEIGGEEFIEANVFNNGNNLIFSVPDLSDYSFTAQRPEGQSDETETVSFSPEEMKRIREKAVEFYYEAYDNAEITYTDGEFTVAGETIKGTEIKTVFSPEILNEYYKKFEDYLKNDEYLRNYFTQVSGKDASEYDEMFDNTKAESPFEIRNYIGANGVVLAKTMLSPEPEASVSAAKNGDKTVFEFYSEDGVIKITDEKNKEDKTSGKTEISFTESEEDENRSLVLDLIYEGVGTEEFNGYDMAVGSYTLKFSDKDTFVDSLFKGISATEKDEADSDISTELENSTDDKSDVTSGLISNIVKKFEFSFSSKLVDEKMRSDFAIKFGSYLELSSYLEVSKFTSSEKPQMPSLTDDKTIPMINDIDEKTQIEIEIDFFEHLSALIDKNSSLSALFNNGGLKEDINEAIESKKNSLAVFDHYSAYTDDTPRNAENCAKSLYQSFEKTFIDQIIQESGISELELNSTLDILRNQYYAPTTVKVYYDSNGKPIVLDYGSDELFDFTYLDFNKVAEAATGSRVTEEELKNLYCEFTVDIYNAKSILTGVTVVYTDNPVDIPEGLPTTYNFIDGLYDGWNNDNIMDGFVVGTYPYLTDGVSTAEERIKQELEDRQKNSVVSTEGLDFLNTAAKKIDYTLYEFLKENKDVEFTDDYYTAEIVLTCGENGWTVLGASDPTYYYDDENGAPENISDIFTKDFTASLEKYFNEKLTDMSGLKAQLFLGKNYTDTGIVVSIAGAGAYPEMETEPEYMPGYYDYYGGFYMLWNMMNYSAENTAGVLWIDENSYTLYGSYCNSTSAPLSSEYIDYENIQEY